MVGGSEKDGGGKHRDLDGGQSHSGGGGDARGKFPLSFFSPFAFSEKSKLPLRLICRPRTSGLSKILQEQSLLIGFFDG
jgi:hypothetical protein